MTSIETETAVVMPYSLLCNVLDGWYKEVEEMHDDPELPLSFIIQDIYEGTQADRLDLVVDADARTSKTLQVYRTNQGPTPLDIQNRGPEGVIIFSPVYVVHRILTGDVWNSPSVDEPVPIDLGINRNGFVQFSFEDQRIDGFSHITDIALRQFASEIIHGEPLAS